MAKPIKPDAEPTVPPPGAGSLAGALSRNIEAVAKRRAEDAKNTTPGVRLALAIGRVIGQMGFVYANIVFYGVWVAASQGRRRAFAGQHPDEAQLAPAQQVIDQLRYQLTRADTPTPGPTASPAEAAATPVPTVEATALPSPTTAANSTPRAVEPTQPAIEPTRPAAAEPAAGSRAGPFILGLVAGCGLTGLAAAVLALRGRRRKN